MELPNIEMVNIHHSNMLTFVPCLHPRPQGLSPPSSFLSPSCFTSTHGFKTKLHVHNSTPIRRKRSMITMQSNDAPLTSSSSSSEEDDNEIIPEPPELRELQSEEAKEEEQEEDDDFIPPPPKLRQLEDDEDDNQTNSSNSKDDVDSSNKVYDEYMKYLQEIAETEGLQTIDPLKNLSHEMITFDEEGIAPVDRYVYVEEKDCIGCTHCATTAKNTFFLEPEHGRARVFDQLGDAEGSIEDAINTCPVNCIYYVNWDDLVTLELERKQQFINNWARLVGGQDFLSIRKAKKKTTVMDSGIMRCEDCPGRGCSTCPLFGVGENPEYIKNKMKRKAKKKKQDEENQLKSSERRRKSF